jgi:hypothetical protein
MPVPRGSIYGFLGANGRGQTTALRLVLASCGERPIDPHGGSAAWPRAGQLFSFRRQEARRELIAESRRPSPLLPHRPRESRSSRRLLGLDARESDRVLRSWTRRRGCSPGRSAIHWHADSGSASPRAARPAALLILDEPTNEPRSGRYPESCGTCGGACLGGDVTLLGFSHLPHRN